MGPSPYSHQVSTMHREYVGGSMYSPSRAVQTSVRGLQCAKMRAER